MNPTINDEAGQQWLEQSQPIGGVDRLGLFATPVFVYELPELEALGCELVEILLSESERTAGIQRSNVGG